MYKLYCEICGYKRLTTGEKSELDGLYELKVSPIPNGIPLINPQTKRVEQPKDKKPLKRFRCPKCGRVLFPKKIVEPVIATPPPDLRETNVEEPMGIQLEVPGQEENTGETDRKQS